MDVPLHSLSLLSTDPPGQHGSAYSQPSAVGDCRDFQDDSWNPHESVDDAAGTATVGYQWKSAFWR